MSKCLVCHQPAHSRGEVFVCGHRCFERLKREPEYEFGNIATDTLRNTDYRRVVFTSQQQQLVLMSILPSEGIPAEIHPHTTQFIRIESGTGYVRLNMQDKVELSHGSNNFVHIGAGVEHEIVVTGTEPLKLYTIYSPPEHPRGLVQKRSH